MPIRAGNSASDTIGAAMWEKQKRPRGISSGRNSSMIKGYVKGARKVNLIFVLNQRVLQSPKRAAAGVASQAGQTGWILAKVDS